MTDSPLDLVRARLGEVSPQWFARFALTVTGLLTLALAVDLGSGGVMFVFWRRTILVFAVAALGIALLLAAWRAPYLLTSNFYLLSPISYPLSLLLFLLTAALMLFLFLGPWRDSFQSLPARFLLLWLASLLASCFLSRQPDTQTPDTDHWSLITAHLFFSLLLASLYNLASYLFLLAPTPFSIGWSEATRYYHASLLLSERYYGISLPPFYQDLSRYVVEVFPLLLPQPSLLLERIWEYSLRFLLPALTVFLILRRLTPDSKVSQLSSQRRETLESVRQNKKESVRIRPRSVREIRVQKSIWLALFLWGTLFLLQGPVYFYLLPAAIPILAFYHPNKPIQSILALLAASLWAGISRVNWLPIPAMLAIALYLLETPLPRRLTPDTRHLTPILRYLAPPALYTLLGLATAYAARLWYADLSLASDAMFNASFIQQLLWYRLFPSALNSWGILPSALLMAAPLTAFLASHLRAKQWHWIRVFGLVAILLLLFTGGIIVSAKIGGGNNLHNLDGFSVLCVTIGLYLLFARFTPDDKAGEVSPSPIGPLTLSLAVLAVTVFTTNAITPALPSLDRHEDSLAELQSLVDETVADGGSVLFITQRHLLTFDLITGVPLVPEWDNIDLMEYAITNYRPMIDQFHADIAAHKYALIIGPIPPGRLLESDSAFSEENNAWLKRVSIPLLRSYKIIAVFEEGDFVVLIPDK
jgi:hypothetical protein